MDSYFCTQFSNIIVPIMDYLGAKSVNQIQNWSKPNYLYYISDSLWLSGSYDWKDHILDVRLGRLYLCKSFLPRLDVLEEYYDYLYELCGKGIINKKEFRNFNLLPDGVHLLAKTLLIVLSNYEQLTNMVKEKIKQKEERVKPYLIKEITDLNMLSACIADRN